jgi:hypothetical protein
MLRKSSDESTGGWAASVAAGFFAAGHGRVMAARARPLGAAAAFDFLEILDEQLFHYGSLLKKKERG